jgi:hypothetical protein
MKTFAAEVIKAIAASILIVVGFTIMGTGEESLTFTVLLCLAKIAMIFGGGCLLIHNQGDNTKC